MKKRILLLEPDTGQAELFARWLKEVNYEVKLEDNQEEIPSSLSEKKFDMLIMSLDHPRTINASLELARALKKDQRFQEFLITALTYRKEVKKITSAIEAGVDNFVLKPFKTDFFLKHIETIFKEFELKKQGKKVLDLNYINFLVQLASEASRKDFFLLASTIFNRLIMDKVKGILGEPVVMVIAKRLKKLSEEDCESMREVKFSGMQFLMDEMDKASKGVPVKRLVVDFRNYVYAFLHLVRVLTSDILMERGRY